MITQRAPVEATGPFALATKTRKGHLRRIPDTRFNTWEAALDYGMKYHSSAYSLRRFEIVLHPDAKNS